MDKNDNQIYKKAIDAYGKGELNKALDICERGISKNLRNAPLLNLKGLLLYLSGDLKGAQGVWKLNKDTNRNPVAANYLENINQDWERLILYKEAAALIEKIKIHAAEEKLIKCAESSFNQIAVSNLLATCYLKKGEYEKCKLWLEKAMAVDKYNKDSLGIKDELITLGIENKKSNLKSLIFTAVAIIIIGAITFGALKYLNKENTINKDNIEPQNNEAKIVENKTTEEKKEPEKKETEVKALPNIQEAIDKKDYITIYDYLVKTKDMNLSINDKVVRSKGEELLKTEGIEQLYKNASNLTKGDKYNEAISLLSICEEYGKENYLYPHIVYLRATSEQKVGNIEKAIEYYKYYIDKYPKTEYVPECLYRLVMIYKDIDKEQAKIYAKKIVEEYNNSIYNNSTVQGLLK